MRMQDVMRERARRAAMERVRLNAAIERALVGDIARWIARVGNLAASHLRAGHTHAAEMAGYELAPRLRSTLRARLRNAAEASARLVLRDLDKAAPHVLERKGFIADVISAAVDWIESYAASRVVQIAETTRKLIRRQILAGTDEPASYRQTAKRIVEATSGDIGKARAIRIARTETHGASERGNIEAVRATGFRYAKRWLAVHDKRTRPDHIEADGQTRRLDDRFVVGGFRMDFPGDQTAPAGQVINCRCVTQNIPLIPGMDIGLPS